MLAISHFQTMDVASEYPSWKSLLNPYAKNSFWYEAFTMRLGKGYVLRFCTLLILAFITWPCNLSLSTYSPPFDSGQMGDQAGSAPWCPWDVPTGQPMADFRRSLPGNATCFCSLMVRAHLTGVLTSPRRTGGS